MEYSFSKTEYCRVTGVGYKVAGFKETEQNERSSDCRPSLYSAAELSRLVSQAGFANVRIYGSLEGAPYDHRASRLKK
jgi:hypothetical protein